jgi:hypothetical protein
MMVTCLDFLKNGFDFKKTGKSCLTLKKLPLCYKVFSAQSKRLPMQLL